MTTTSLGHLWVHAGSVCQDCGALAVFQTSVLATSQGDVVTVVATCPASEAHILNMETHRLLAQLARDT
jgi:hypothetical protein